jgi:hypothetical protein
VNCHAASSQVVDAHDAANHVPPHVVKDQHLPNGLAIFAEYRRRLWEEAIYIAIALLVGTAVCVVVEVENFLNCGCTKGSLVFW